MPDLAEMAKNIERIAVALEQIATALNAEHGESEVGRIADCLSDISDAFPECKQEDGRFVRVSGEVNTYSQD